MLLVLPFPDRLLETEYPDCRRWPADGVRVDVPDAVVDRRDDHAYLCLCGRRSDPFEALHRTLDEARSREASTDAFPLQLLATHHSSSLGRSRSGKGFPWPGKSSNSPRSRALPNLLLDPRLPPHTRRLSRGHCRARVPAQTLSFWRQPVRICALVDARTPRRRASIELSPCLQAHGRSRGSWVRRW